MEPFKPVIILLITLSIYISMPVLTQLSDRLLYNLIKVKEICWAKDAPTNMRANADTGSHLVKAAPSCTTERNFMR